MTAALFLLAAVLLAAYLVVRSVNRRGAAATVDRICFPEHRPFGEPITHVRITERKHP